MITERPFAERSRFCRTSPTRKRGTRESLAYASGWSRRIMRGDWSYNDGMDFDLTQLTERLRGHVTRLASTPRPHGSPEHQRAKEYIHEHLKEAGFQVG